MMITNSVKAVTAKYCQFIRFKLLPEPLPVRKKAHTLERGQNRVQFTGFVGVLQFLQSQQVTDAEYLIATKSMLINYVTE